MLGNDSFVWCCQGVASENVASRKSLAMLSCGVLGALLGGIAGYLLGVYYLSPIFPSQEPGWRPSLLFPSYFRKTWHTILLAVCLVLRRETCPKAQNTICVGHCPDTAIHDNTSLLVSVSSLDSRWFSFPLQDRYHDILGCVQANGGLHGCTHLAQHWLNEAVEPSERQWM